MYFSDTVIAVVKRRPHSLGESRKRTDRRAGNCKVMSTVTTFKKTGTQPSEPVISYKNRRRKHYNAMLLSCKAQAAQLKDT